jgi:hypothetical protein
MKTIILTWQMTAFVLLICFSGLVNAASFNLNLEYRQLTDVNPPFSRRVYICTDNCPNAVDWDAQTPDPGWQLAPARVQLFDSADAVLPVPPPGVPGVIDLNGATLSYVADVETATPIFEPGGPYAVAQVARDTVLTYDSGNVIHEVTDPDGSKYVLFTAEVAVAHTYDLTIEGALIDMLLPGGWAYSSQTLVENLDVDSGGLATVFASPTTTWQLYATTEVPIPTAAWLFGSALLGLAVMKRKKA